jgi:uracil-DNA glycosylase
MVGEQPGDVEDQTGRPFTGPAGRVLDRALDESGIDRREVYLTNAVKHFKWTRRGKVRLHKTPAGEDIRACRPWLDAELRVVRPRVLVCLGAIAAKALLGGDFRVTKQRGQLIESDLAPFVLATVHPSSVLRAPDDDAREAAFRGLVDDLVKVAEVLSG